LQHHPDDYRVPDCPPPSGSPKGAVVSAPRITLDWLAQHNACRDARDAFAAKFTDGADYGVVQAVLHDEQRTKWSAWLTDRVWSDLLASPESTGTFIDSEVARSIAETKDSPNFASGDYSTAASSGNYSKAASSGKNTIAMVAGLNGRAKAGPNGCLALCWHDGTRNRIVVGYVGENIKVDTWYRVKNGALIEVTP